MGRSSRKQGASARLRRSIDPSTKIPARQAKSKRQPQPQPKKAAEPLTEFSRSQHLPLVVLSGLVLLPALLWAYWPTLVWMEQQWRTEPDYSHGYLILPLAGLIAYNRRDLFPGLRPRVSWLGVGLILVAIAMRLVGRFAYMDFLDGWSLLPWTAGVVWMLMGPKAVRWALPAILFLFLLVPLPYQAESLLSWKLQGVATHASTALLRILGQPAVSEGHTIWLGDSQLMVEEACSGLRIFVGVGALAFFWAAMARRSWIDGVVILAMALPLAILANVFRVTAMGFFSTWYEGPTLDEIHDWVGIAMIGVAAFMLWSVKAYWECLYRPLEIHTARQRLQSL
ncbi:exosortase/archaeosortase family protein [Candidatus Laterigemmans baculatus]|uniref:exosortase/archaeosortase family protein n=1 Tax=Candidatus Laterigemmans baculatus TaxID=2770505 RepID=UPI0013DCD920|nr:exosortase/archaeosortase family protein [Candidatus Laterigemmans baculatus]